MKIAMTDLRHLLSTSAALGSRTTLIALGLDKPEIKKADAYRKYGRRTVDRWVDNKSIKLITRGRKTLLSVAELEVLASSEELNKLIDIKK